MSAENPISVHAFNSLVKDRITRPAPIAAAVIGEITQLTLHTSGHMYFTLRDKAEGASSSRSIVRCNFFHWQRKGIGFRPQEGMEVIVTGKADLYLVQGSYSLNADFMIQKGVGNLFAAIQELRQRLVKEGLIDPSKRRPLPRLVHHIGIVTSAEGAGLQDMLKQFRYRYPNVNVTLAPATVQGAEAPASIIDALELLYNFQPAPDVIIVGRGGGNPEDLMAFSDEGVVRKIAASPVPIISAVGHEIDHPVSDDVADFAATTPTHAAQTAAASVAELQDSLENIHQRLYSLLDRKLELILAKFRPLAEHRIFREPESLIREQQMALDDLDIRLSESLRNVLDEARERMAGLADIHKVAENRFLQWNHRLELASSRLLAYSPLSTLNRGYAAVFSADGGVITEGRNLKIGEVVSIRFQDVSRNAQITG